MLRKVSVDKGAYQIVGQDVMSLPRIDWYQLYNITGVARQPATMPGVTPIPNVYKSSIPPPPPPPGPPPAGLLEPW